MDKKGENDRINKNDEIKETILYGYSRPPEQNRFKKGQSGNPKGRLRKEATRLSLADQPTLSAMLNAANKMVTLREDGRTREVTRRQAVIEATIVTALKGNARSQALALQHMAKADAAHARELRERIALWKNYKQVHLAEIAAAKAQGRPAPTPLPHPDDIIIDYTTGPRFIGPLDETELAKVEETIRYRDLMIPQDVLDQRSAVQLDGTPLTEPVSAALFAEIFNRALPPRLRFSDLEWAFRVMRHEGTPMRELLKQLVEAWRSIGKPRPRGFVMQNLSAMRSNVEKVYALVQQLNTGELDADRMTKADWVELVSDMWANE